MAKTLAHTLGSPRAPATVATEGTDTGDTQDYAADTDTERKLLTRSLTESLILRLADFGVFANALMKSVVTEVLGDTEVEVIPLVKALNMPLRISQHTLHEQPGVPREVSCDAATSSWSGGNTAGIRERIERISSSVSQNDKLMGRSI